MFALRLAAQRPCLAGQTISAYSGVRRSVCTQLRGMATSGTSSGGTVAPPPPAAAEQQQQPASSSAQPQEQQQPKVRNYPDEPRVGVGIVILRQLPPADTPEVLLIRRAKEPSKGTWLGQLQAECIPGVLDLCSVLSWLQQQQQLAQGNDQSCCARPQTSKPCPATAAPAGKWCFPGGSLELGESLVECAVRETLEETGIRLRNTPRHGG